MKVLFVSPNSWMYGAERSLLLAVKGLVQQGVECEVMSDGPGPLVDALVQEGIVVHVESYRYLALRWPFPYFAWIFRFFQLFRKISPDIVHSNDRVSMQFIVPVAKLLGIPIVCHVRNMTTAGRFELYRGLSFCADRYVANSEAVRSDLQAHGYDSRRVNTVYNAVESSLFDIIQDPQRTEPIIGVIGRIESGKGHADLFAALTRIPHLEWRCSVFGDAARSVMYMEQLRIQLNEVGLAERVEWPGYVKNLVAMYAHLDIVAVPSLQESFGRVAAEAMASGIPVVAYSVGGLQEVVADCETGFLVPPGNDKALADALRMLVCDHVLRKKMGTKGRERARKIFGIDSHVNGLLQVYSQLTWKNSPN